MEQNPGLDKTSDEKPETEYLTDSEMALSALIVEKYAPGLSSDQCSVLLAQVRKFAGIVGGRHYVYGWSDGKKEAEGKATGKGLE